MARSHRISAPNNSNRASSANILPRRVLQHWKRYLQREWRKNEGERRKVDGERTRSSSSTYAGKHELQHDEPDGLEYVWK